MEINKLKNKISLSYFVLVSMISISGLLISLFNPIVEATPSSMNRVSLDTGGSDADNHVNIWDISEDGQYVLFESSATDLVTGDTNGKQDMFVRDTVNNTTERISVDSSEVQSNDHSHKGKLSNNGRYVVFTSSATNLVSGDTNAKNDIFLRDRDAGTTEMVSLDNTGGLPDNISDEPEISTDGRFIVFSSHATDLVTGDTNNQMDVFVRDRTKNTNSRISISEAGVQGDGQSYRPSMSCDGRYIVFNSAATNLVSGDTNGYRDVFLYDTMGGLVKNVSIGGNHVSDPTDITCDGSKIVFHTLSTNLVSGDTNANYDVLQYTVDTQTLERVSLADDESQATGESIGATVSGDGRYIAFESSATNLIASDTNTVKDIFLRDTVSGTTIRLSEKSDATQSNAQSNRAFISKDGKYVGFGSSATNLIAGDTNAKDDVFIADTGNTPSVCY